YFCVDLSEVTRATEDALPRIGGVRYIGCRCRVRRQLHEALGAGCRGCAGIPLRFLVADRGQQAPVLTALSGRLFEPFLIQRQTALQMPHEGGSAGEFQVLRTAVV